MFITIILNRFDQVYEEQYMIKANRASVIRILCVIFTYRKLNLKTILVLLSFFKNSDSTTSIIICIQVACYILKCRKA